MSQICGSAAGLRAAARRLLRPATSPLQEARRSQEDAAKEQEQAANAYLHLNSYLALPAPGAPPDGGMAAQQPYGLPPQF